MGADDDDAVSAAAFCTGTSVLVPSVESPKSASLSFCYFAERKPERPQEATLPRAATGTLSYRYSPRKNKSDFA